MTTKQYRSAATVLSAAGVAFAGYLSFTRFTSGICAFNESCPFFLGQPACYVGFALFIDLFLISALAWAMKSESSLPMIANALVSAAGVAFAIRVATEELSTQVHYRLGLPTCAYGLVFFLAVLVISVWAFVRRAQRLHANTPARTSCAQPAS